MKNKRGITLIALVITIIILLILAGITIIQLTESGIFSKTKLAKDLSINAEEKEKNTLSEYDNILESYINNSRNNITSFKILFEDSSGAVSGTLSESINNFDILIAIYGTAVDAYMCNSEIFTPSNKKIEFDFSNGSDTIYGCFEFNEQNFTRTILMQGYRRMGRQNEII